MKVIARSGSDDIAVVYVVALEEGKQVECVESLTPNIARDDKWILMISTLNGCPVGCPMCDAGWFYKGKLTKTEILDQIDFLVEQRYPDRIVRSKQFKIQFARMGEPALNPAVLEVLEDLPGRYQAKGLMPSISTVAPEGTDRFFAKLAEIKRKYYSGGRFQLQFSLHATDLLLRDTLIPIKKWSFHQISTYVNEFWDTGDRKITLNFALEKNTRMDRDIVLHFFHPDKFLIKLTPLNPTFKAQKNNLQSAIDPLDPELGTRIVRQLQSIGYDVILSIGNTEENLIGSNCGQYLRSLSQKIYSVQGAYTYSIHA